MIYLFLCFALNLCMQLQAADADTTQENRWENKSVILQFPDDEDKILILPASTITCWSKTIKELVEDLGTDLPVPVSNVYQLSVECLEHLATEKNELFTLFDFSKPLEKIKDHCAVKLNDIKYQCLSRKDLLLHANYLDVYPQSFKSALASFYASTLKTKIPNITKQIVSPQVNIYFDEIPHELEPLVAQWLLYALVREKSVETTRSTAFTMNTNNLVTGPFISHSSLPHGFACAWAESGDTTRFAMRTQLSHLFYIDFYTPTSCKKWQILHTDICPNSYCATSADGRYTLVTIKADANYCGLYLRDQKMPHFKETSLYQKAENVQALVYNDASKSFNIIVYKKTDHSPYKEILYFFELDPSQENLSIKTVAEFNDDTYPVVRNSDVMDWSCIQGDLVGLHVSDLPIALICRNKQLCECTYNPRTNLWTYSTESDEEEPAPFTVVYLGGMVTKKNNTAMAIERSCIPQFEQTICERYPNMDTVQNNSYALCFDPNHLCYNYLKKSEKDSNTVIAKTKSLFSPQLAAAIQHINRKILAGEKRVLIDTYALYHHVINPDIQDTYCGHLYQYLSSEIKKYCEFKI